MTSSSPLPCQMRWRLGKEERVSMTMTSSNILSKTNGQKLITSSDVVIRKPDFCDANRRHTGRTATKTLGTENTVIRLPIIFELASIKQIFAPTIQSRERWEGRRIRSRINNDSPEYQACFSKVSATNDLDVSIIRILTDHATTVKPK